ncbi:MarR family transcriptional regulator [Candidatus Bathyarchaeota archaeon]|nr:MarR family transcriptional regulator [Candidatus Bathyarchaeota archaeon]
MISDFMFIVTSILLLVTIFALLLYYKRITRASLEYENAKGVVNNIIVSIDNQFKRQKDRFLFVAQKIENIILDNKKIGGKIVEFDERLIAVTGLIADVPSIEKKFSEEINQIQNDVEGIIETQERVLKKINALEKIRQESNLPEVKIEAAIPIRREKALEPLTETELRVLETIGKEGQKTAPEIREKISLTREHTARLMKKLYKDGYLERDTYKMPYIYRLKEEMQKILKKRETNSP